MILRTERLVLRAPDEPDVEPLTAILQQPEVARFWHGYDAARVHAELVRKRDDVSVLVIEPKASHGRVIGAIQWYEQSEPDYRHAGIDLFLDASEQHEGLGPEAIHAVVAHLVDERGHHRVVIDPAKDNLAARRAYEKVGFRTVGVLRRYERDAHGVWRDGVLMELVREEDHTKGPRAQVSARDANAADPILEMMVEFNRGEGIAFDPKSAPLADLLADPRLGRVLVFEVAGEIAGYAIVTFGFDLEFGGRDSYLTELYVGDRFRDRGVGGAALDAVMDAARAAGARTLHLQVRPDNPAAIHLYRRAGFETSLRMFMSKKL